MLLYSGESTGAPPTKKLEEEEGGKEGWRRKKQHQPLLCSIPGFTTVALYDEQPRNNMKLWPSSHITFLPRAFVIPLHICILWSLLLPNAHWGRWDDHDHHMCCLHAPSLKCNCARSIVTYFLKQEGERNRWRTTWTFGMWAYIYIAKPIEIALGRPGSPCFPRVRTPHVSPLFFPFLFLSLFSSFNILFFCISYDSICFAGGWCWLFWEKSTCLVAGLFWGKSAGGW